MDANSGPRQTVEQPVRFGNAELLPDPDRPTGWRLVVDGVLQSYVDLSEPTYLRLPYTTWIAQLLDRHWPGHAPVSAVQVGGGGFSLPRYLAATRPGSNQLVFELDDRLVDLVRAHLGLDRVPGLRVRAADGRAGVVALPEDSVDLVVLDAFRGGVVATDLATVEFVRGAARVLRPGGLYASNLWDSGELGFALRAVASATEVFRHAVVFAETGVLLNQRPGNVVLAASDRDLPTADLVAWASSTGNRVFCLTAAQLTEVCGPATPLTEADPLLDAVPPVRSWPRQDQSG
ncbi:spermidine synthase [Goodfellowiella coeruleoviolacea]|uniref:Spermidine synthase n=1 Tax=Goodfellowiella coeruleoviolacea TaxID=334858 RepID=A0AAE3KNB6_9PSEU|nr:fused MFS/spermidine synthase [Goodfellowiella coeruleoviolacea]MCP2168518.1 Spermidine synthase [Goodfellowiella coeruleoviolacea]